MQTPAFPLPNQMLLLRLRTIEIGKPFWRQCKWPRSTTHDRDHHARHHGGLRSDEKLEPLQGKAFRFSPLIGRDDVSKGILGDLVERVFDGSAEAVMVSLFDVKELDEEELANLRKLLNKKMREAKS